MKIFTKIIPRLIVSLTLDERKRGRLKVATGSGEYVGIQIERGQILRDETWLSANDNTLLCVLAKNESVSSAYIDDPTLFARACYHLGNRHVPLQIGDSFLRYQSDYVLDDMLNGLGITVEQQLAPFEPEDGAYSSGANHAHGHSHTHQHDIRNGHHHG